MKRELREAVVFKCAGSSRQEGDDLRFFFAEELPDNISPPVRGAIEDWKKRKVEEQGYI